LIFLIISDKKGRILYLGNLYLGLDMGVFKKELAHFNYANVSLRMDLGFTGAKDLVKGGTIEMGYKRSKELTDMEK
jgi:hypothetical protein